MHWLSRKCHARCSPRAKRVGWRAALFAVMLLGMNGISAAPEKTVVTLGTATPGGGFPAYGAAYAATINESEPTLMVEPRNTKGSTENIPLLEAGKLDLGQATGEVTYEAIHGIGRSPADLRVVNAMYSNSGMFIMPAAAPYRTLADLRGKPIAWGARGSGFVVLARYAFDGLGLDIERDFQAVYLEKAADGPAMLLDGRVAALWGGGVGWPGFMTVAAAPGGARFIAPDAEEIRRIVAKHAFIKQVTLPAGSYPGQRESIHSVGSWAFVLARPTLPDDVAYRIARALHKSETTFAERLAQARESTLANPLTAVPRQDLIHPGVLRYMREAGLAR